ncbi:hypothetical protein FB45DRAFT_67399 [Roridomyces roridus]|uniref:F-box domain-containing protein n=1 Tax=Roridomyces roridus TaxID=1738132 RepID=A0AAD7BMF7_9AGAR|nr:hypothetical protein FB45DRAFT_67399 [Roridomyces roridus]
MSFPREHLFPNVRGLGFMFHELCLPHTSLFLSPKITRINVELDPAPAYLPLVPLFGAKCPSLTSICLRYRGGRVEAPYHLRARAASTLIQSLDKIRHLTAGPIDVAACGHLMSLPELKSLAVHVHEILMPEVSSESTFRYLESLEICVARPALAFNFLPALSKACPLNNLQIGLEEATALESEARQLCTVIVDCSPTSVESLSVDFGQYSDAAAVSSDLYTVVPATLRPLLALTELVTINVTVPFGLCLDDAFVSEMAAAWPLVQHLTLRRPYVLGEPSPPSLVTVSSLTVFALRCPDLRSLAIPLSDTPPEPVEEPPQSLRPKQTVLTLLEVMDSHIQKPFPVAAYLSSVFPNIRFVATTRQAMDLGDNDPAPQDAEASKRWKQVQELIPLLVGIRESGITVGCWVWKVWSR